MTIATWLLLMSLTGVAPAQAALITFAFGEAGTGDLIGTGDARAYQVESGSVRLTAMGFKGVDLGAAHEIGTDVAGSFVDLEAITRDTSGDRQGLGVDSENGDDDKLDGDGPDEAILFSLNVAGTLVAISFDNFGSDDDFNLIVDGVVLLADAVADSDDVFAGSVPFLQSFAIGASNRDDEFRVRSLTVDVLMGNVVGVPTPGSLGLGLLAALVFLAGRRSGPRGVNSAVAAVAD